MVEKYKAWKFYSAMYKDPAVVKAKILKSMVKPLEVKVVATLCQWYNYE